MVIQTETDNLIFIYVQTVRPNRVFVTVTSLSNQNISNFDWRIRDIESLSKTVLNEQTVVLKYDKVKYHSFRFLPGNKSYHYVGSDLFEYLQGEDSHGGQFYREDNDYKIYLMIAGILFVSVISVMIVKNKDEEDNE